MNLSVDSQPMSYGIGLEELWEISPEKHIAGIIIFNLFMISISTLC